MLAAAPAANARSAEYSGATTPGLPSLGASEASVAGVRAKLAENDSSGDAAATEAAHKRLKKELDRMRRGDRKEKADSKPVSQPAKKPSPQAADAPRVQPQKQPAPDAVSPEISRAAGRLILMRFSGGEPADSGPKAVRSLMHDGQIAGVMFGGDNIQSKAQLKELVKFLAQGGGEHKPLFAISEIGGAAGAFPHVKDFEAWPSEQEVAGKGDPEYAYLTYRSLGSFLAGLGFTMNFGPALGASGALPASFGDSPLQVGVFAKTFVLGHKDDNVLAVPLVDGSDVSVRALKTLLVSYPGMAIAAMMTSEAQPFRAYDGLVRGPRFCMIALKQENGPEEAVSSFNRGCDALVIDGGKDSPAAVRDRVVRGVSDAINNGSLTLASLNASAQRLSTLQSAAEPTSASSTTQTAQ